MIAYNRRFYSSVSKAKEIIIEDGGVSSFLFEFTEWSHIIESLQKADGVKEKWLLSNSTHVIDLVFYLCGFPLRLHTLRDREDSWHPSGTVFSGCGQTINGALFSYHADWDAPGRWSVEVLTRKRRIVLCPLEKLEVITKGSVKKESVKLDDQLDHLYKPGLFLQVNAFINGDFSQLCLLEQQVRNIKEIYNPIAGYCD